MRLDGMRRATRTADKGTGESIQVAEGRRTTWSLEVGGDRWHRVQKPWYRGASTPCGYPVAWLSGSVAYPRESRPGTACAYCSRD